MPSTTQPPLHLFILQIQTQLLLPFGDEEDVDDFQNTSGVEDEEDDKPPRLVALGRLPQGPAFPGDGPNGDCRQEPPIIDEKV